MSNLTYLHWNYKVFLWYVLMMDNFINIKAAYLWHFNNFFAYINLLTFNFEYAIILKGRESVLINIPYNFNVNMSDLTKNKPVRHTWQDPVFPTVFGEHSHFPWCKFWSCRCWSVPEYPQDERYPWSLCKTCAQKSAWNYAGKPFGDLP